MKELNYADIILMIDEYLEEPHSIDSKWVEALTICKEVLIEKENEQEDEYEDLEEKGLLLILPCKIGDTVYELINTSCSNCSHGNSCDGISCPDPKIIKMIFDFDLIKNFGKTVFLTKEEAEKILNNSK